MKIHEYQAKTILKTYGATVPEGGIAESPEEALRIAKNLGKYPVVIKAQVHVGGRGKAGGVKLAFSDEEALAKSKEILGMNIKNSIVKKVLIEPGIDIAKELYVGITIDRTKKYPVLMASPAGGIDIEETAVNSPEKILKLTIKPHLGIQAFQIRSINSFLQISKEQYKSMARFIKGLINAFFEKHCSLAEINPLVITKNGEIIACDAKMNFDDNAIYSLPDIAILRDESEEDLLESEARRKRLNYVRLDGKIGCIVNGAGLAMATMDVVKHFGGEPANFLDIGGGAKAEQVAETLRIITKDPKVNTILINIFGGIVRCDLVAEGLLAALKSMPDFKMPIVVRLSGTNEDIAREMLKGTSLIAEPTMSSAAKRAVAISKSV